MRRYKYRYKKSVFIGMRNFTFFYSFAPNSIIFGDMNENMMEYGAVTYYGNWVENLRSA